MTIRLASTMGLLACLIVGACNNGATNDTTATTDRVASTKGDDQANVVGNATLTMGEESYELDFALCVIEPDNAVRIAASDNQSRPDYPVVRIRYFPDRVVKPPVFSVEFRQTVPHLLWRLDSGAIRPTEPGHTASGILNATEMTNDERGKRMIPMDESFNRDFSLDVRCSSSSPQPKASKPRRAASLTFDGKQYQFDFVMCAPGSLGTTMVVGSDKANRASYPMVRASVFPDQPPESVANTISLDFQNATPRVLWLRHEANIQKTNGGLVADGTLHGQEMTLQPNGLQKPVPLATDAIKSFALDVTC
ncbi:MAG: hypothetical protein AAF004_14025 [Pseudomonadota bacterium]